MQTHSHESNEKATLLEKSIAVLMTSIAELIFITPFSVAGTRVQGYLGEIFTRDLKASFATLDKVIKTGGSLYSGVLATAVDKVIVKRGYKFVGQGVFRDNLLKPYCGKTIEDYFGEKHKKSIIETIAGALTGVGEVIFLPLDYWRTNTQKNCDAFKNRKLYTVLFSKEAYVGWKPTCWRNFFGSGYLFGLKSVLEEWQVNQIITNLIASTMSVVGTMPWDVLKVRLQIAAANGEKEVSSSKMAGKMWKEGGPMLFFRGGAIKTTSSVVKLALFITLYDWLKKNLHEALKNTPEFNFKDDAPHRMRNR